MNYIYVSGRRYFLSDHEWKHLRPSDPVWLVAAWPGEVNECPRNVAKVVVDAGLLGENGPDSRDAHAAT